MLQASLNIYGTSSDANTSSKPSDIQGEDNTKDQVDQAYQFSNLFIITNFDCGIFVIIWWDWKNDITLSRQGRKGSQIAMTYRVE